LCIKCSLKIITVLDIILDKKTATEASIKVKLIETDYQPKVEEKIKEYSKKAKVNGFRPGKVPAGVIKRLYGKSILVEEISSIINDKLKGYIADQKLELLGEPLPNEESAKNIDWDNQKEFEFVYDLGLVDDFKAELSNKIKVTKYQIKVDDKIINETIENIAKQNGTTTNPEQAGSTDTVFGKLTAEGGEEKDSYLKLDELEKSAAKLLIHKKAGDAVEIKIEKAFKTDEAKADALAVSLEEAKAIKGSYTFTIERIIHTEPAELNQEFFDRVFGKDAVKDEKEFRAKVKSTIEENYNRETEVLLDRHVQKALVDQFKFELPDAFLKRWLKASNEKITDADIAQEYDLYTQDLRWNLITSKLAKQHDVKVEHTDVIEKTKDMIRKQFGSMGMLEQLEASLDSFADNYLKGEKGENYYKMFEQVRADKILSLIKEKIEIKTKETDLEGFKKAIEN
jgi:trigger factor